MELTLESDPVKTYQRAERQGIYEDVAAARVGLLVAVWLTGGLVCLPVSQLGAHPIGSMIRRL